MAEAISALSNVQLGLLQSPEIAREQIPITGQAALANAQAAAIIARDDKTAAETVHALQEIDSRGVPNALVGQRQGGSPGYRRRPPLREPVSTRVVPLAAAHPRGLGSLVDLRA